MSTITYGLAPSGCAAERPAAAVAGKRKGLFARFVAHLMAARQKQAMEEIRRRGLLLPHEMEAASWKVTERSEDSLPFLR
jgi:hypothetical protein